MRHIRISIILLPLLLVVLPLTGVMFRGETLGPYLEFPPLTRYVQHAPFSLSAFIFLALLVLVFLLPLFRNCIRAAGYVDTRSHPKRPFPLWGYGGIILIGVSWFLAWTRFEWFVPLQAYTFFPLWLGYIVSINALTCSRTGNCLLVNRTRFFLALFPASCLFWWFFEYLNRFVQNWHYRGVENFSPAQYLIHASLCFTTVLPAVQSTAEFLASFTGLTVSLKNWRPLSLDKPQTWGWFLLIFSGAALAGIAVYPDYLFPMLWVAPFLIITGVQAVCREKTLFHTLPAGDWRLIWLPALAALTCGFFWELWNVRSLAHWEYSVPFVQRFHLFEMPVLGYAGYLPFGLECMAVSMMLDRLLGTEVYEKNE
jgi:hypothetical protein